MTCLNHLTESKTTLTLISYFLSLPPQNQSNSLLCFPLITPPLTLVLDFSHHRFLLLRLVGLNLVFKSLKLVVSPSVSSSSFGGLKLSFQIFEACRRTLFGGLWTWIFSIFEIWMLWATIWWAWSWTSNLQSLSVVSYCLMGFEVELRTLKLKCCRPPFDWLLNLGLESLKLVGL